MPPTSFVPPKHLDIVMIDSSPSSGGKATSLLELHSSSVLNICHGVERSSPTNSPLKQRTRMKSDDEAVDDDEFANELARYCDDEIANENQRQSDALMLSPINHVVGAFSPINNMSVAASSINETNNSLSTSVGDERDDAPSLDDDNHDGINFSFPDNDNETIEIRRSSDGMSDDDNSGDVVDVEEHEETEEERMQREIEESVALARQLMAEEAMASYAMSTEFLRQNSDQFSSEDFAALQAAMAEEDPGESGDNETEEANDDEYDDSGESQELSYDALLRLGEQIGDVKEERWALIAHEKIRQLPTLLWKSFMAVGKEENHTLVKCQVCQFPYEDGEELRNLPICGHYFHRECVDSWLQTKNTCALCRKAIC